MSLCTERGCGLPAVVEKAGKSVCRAHADKIKGYEYPVREASWTPRDLGDELRDLGYEGGLYEEDEDEDDIDDDYEDECDDEPFVFQAVESECGD